MRILGRGLLTAVLLAGMIVVPALAGIGQAAPDRLQGGPISPFRGVATPRGPVAPPMSSLTPGPSRGVVPPPATAVRPLPQRAMGAPPMTPRPLPQGMVMAPDRAVRPVAPPVLEDRSALRPQTSPQFARSPETTLRQPRVVQEQPRLAPETRTLRQPSLTREQPQAPPAQFAQSPETRVLRQPRVTQAQPQTAPAQVGQSPEIRALRRPSVTQTQPPRAPLTGTRETRLPRQPGVAQPRPAPVRPAPQVRTPGPAITARPFAAQDLQSWVRARNEGVRTLPGRDVLGREIPRGAVVIDPDRLAIRNRDFLAIRDHFGRPANRFAFLPRTSFPRDFFVIRNGHEQFRRHHHHTIVVLNFFYPFYFSDPFWFGFAYPGYYPSIYVFWGWTPGWIYPDRVFYAPPPVYLYGPANPYYLYGGSYVDSVGVERAINDLRDAWITGNVQLIAPHLTDQQDVAVYFSGKYEYTTSSQDYYAMTVDAISTTQTTVLDFNDPVWISPREVFYTGRHVFTDPDGNRKTVYVSYRLRKLGSDWYIAGVGSSLEPIQSDYHDFRYQ